MSIFSSSARRTTVEFGFFTFNDNSRSTLVDVVAVEIDRDTGRLLCFDWDFIKLCDNCVDRITEDVDDDELFRIVSEHWWWSDNES